MATAAASPTTDSPTRRAVPTRGPPPPGMSGSSRAQSPPTPAHRDMATVASAIGRGQSGKLPTSNEAFQAYEHRRAEMAPMPSRVQLDNTRAHAVSTLPRPKLIPNAAPEDLIVGYVPDPSRGAAPAEIEDKNAADSSSSAGYRAIDYSTYSGASQSRHHQSGHYQQQHQQQHHQDPDYASPRALQMRQAAGAPPAFDRTSFGDTSKSRAAAASLGSGHTVPSHDAAAAPSSSSTAGRVGGPRSASGGGGGGGPMLVDRRLAPSLSRDDDDDVYYVGETAPQRAPYNSHNDRRFATPTGGGGGYSSSAYRADESYVVGRRPNSPTRGGGGGGGAGGLVNTPRGYTHHVY